MLRTTPRVPTTDQENDVNDDPTDEPRPGQGSDPGRPETPNTPPPNTGDTPPPAGGQYPPPPGNYPPQGNYPP
ncbi:hypothetical protein CH261_22590, partial [Rhodococcus sp. 05-2254-3]